MRSTFCGFTESCKSQCLSYFSAPFIVCSSRDIHHWKLCCSYNCKPSTKMGNIKMVQISQESGKRTLLTVINKSTSRLWTCTMTSERHVHGHNATCTNMTLECVTDPSAGSPTETLLRLLLPLSDEVQQTSKDIFCKAEHINLRSIDRISQSVGATGGVYKGQGRNQRELMTRAYQEFLVEDR